MSQWISVKDRLPVTGSLCLIVWADTVQATAYKRTGIGFACKDGYEWVDAYETADPLPDSEVTHWMPLPEPPEVQP